ncbi:MAG: class I SAM-dependent methyltransferase [Planctomycetota bacterium]
MRWDHGYFTPRDVYQHVVSRAVTETTRWLDVGCGHHIFPSNPGLSRELADRCQLLVGVDPDETVQENPYTHEAHQGFLEDYETDHRFDLITLRMVAEHVVDPDSLIRELERLSAPGARVIILTVHKWSPVPIVTRIVPHGLHHPIKSVIWGTDEKDTFPVKMRMNTRKSLRAGFERRGFREEIYSLRDDCEALAGWKLTYRFEIGLRNFLRRIGLRYPEVCILATYRRVADPAEHAAGVETQR